MAWKWVPDVNTTFSCRWTDLYLLYRCRSLALCLRDHIAPVIGPSAAIDADQMDPLPDVSQQQPITNSELVYWLCLVTSVSIPKDKTSPQDGEVFF